MNFENIKTKINNYKSHSLNLLHLNFGIYIYLIFFSN
jgi:hypothetical protein